GAERTDRNHHIRYWRAEELRAVHRARRRALPSLPAEPRDPPDPRQLHHAQVEEDAQKNGDARGQGTAALPAAVIAAVERHRARVEARCMSTSRETFSTAPSTRCYTPSSASSSLHSHSLATRCLPSGSGRDVSGLLQPI